MIPNIISIITKYSQHANPGKEITNIFYYSYRGLCNRITHTSCYHWRTKMIYEHSIFRMGSDMSEDNIFIQTEYDVPISLRDYGRGTSGCCTFIQS